MRPSKVLVAAILLILGSVAVSVQGPWTTPPGSNGKVRIVSTAADALCVGGSAVAPASSACTGGVYSGPLIVNGSAIASGATWTYVTTTATGTQNDFNPGIVGNTVIRANNASALTITGFASTVAQVSGQMVLVEGINAQVNFTHQATSTAANQLFNIVTTGNTSILLGSALYVYDGTTQRWRLAAHEQGQWITRTFAAGNYTASAGNWTVASATRDAFYLKGRALAFAVAVAGTTSGTPVSVKVTLPNSYSAVSSDIGAAYVQLNGGGGAEMGYWQAATTTINFQRVANTAFAAGTVTVDGIANFEIQ